MKSKLYGNRKLNNEKRKQIINLLYTYDIKRINNILNNIDKLLIKRNYSKRESKLLRNTLKTIYNENIAINELLNSNVSLEYYTQNIDIDNIEYDSTFKFIYGYDN
tara:strand:- start:167 stop:484 length:318 start_codon:yes stop_codon:yes gene_type:complete